MDIRNHVRLTACDLAVNQSTAKMLCPVCNGGQSKELSFTITRTDTGLLYHCFRAKCGAGGIVPDFTGDSSSMDQSGKISSVNREYWYPVRPVIDRDIEYFAERFQIPPEWTHKYVRISEQDEYVLPVYGLSDRLRGYIVRQPRWKGEPECWRKGVPERTKAKTYPHTDKPMQSFCRTFLHDREYPRTLVIVEDQISAVKVAYHTGADSVAILGTGVNLDKVREWQQFGAREVIIALDKDATHLAFQIAKKWGMAFDTAHVAMLEQDLKDTEASDLSEVLGL